MSDFYRPIRMLTLIAAAGFIAPVNAQVLGESPSSSSDASSSSSDSGYYIAPNTTVHRPAHIKPTVPLESTPSWAQQQQIDRDRRAADWNNTVHSNRSTGSGAVTTP